MVARNFIVRHQDSDYDIEYDTSDGLEVFKFQLFSITSIPPDQQKIVSVDDDRIVSDESDLASICDRLRVIEINEEDGANGNESLHRDYHQAAALMISDEELARMLQAEEEALLMQQYAADEDKGQMEEKIRPYVDQVLMYEDPVRQEAARKTVNIDALEEKAMVSLAKVELQKVGISHGLSLASLESGVSSATTFLSFGTGEGNFEPTKAEKDHAFLLRLLYWFKQSFSWVNAPSCDTCGDETIRQGMGTPLPLEIQYGGFRVEIYRCRSCSRITRFPRYNDPLKLLETRKGRCGEWANCFTLYCRTFGYESRLILDLTDHVWTECYSDLLGRWMHLDPCEGVYDKPLLYEKGWNKKLNYVNAIAKDGVYDVTKRYTRKWPEVLSRRNLATESNLASLFAKLTRECRSKGFTSEQISMLEQRDKIEIESLERNLYCEEHVSSSLPGRQSGDKEWRISRSEYGSGEGCASSSTSCPVRLCVDEHVTRVYNAFGPILSKCVDLSLPTSRVIDILVILQDTIKDLIKLPFRSRRSIVKVSSEMSYFFVHEMLPAFSELLDALDLKFEPVSEDVVVSLAGDPVRTSLALPVALDAVEFTIDGFAHCSSLSKESLSWPLLRLNRLHSGSTLASGEEPPHGIATSAFDGTHASKWEEPNGAKGCWIVYKLPDKDVCELAAYVIMSANDAPERDPKDWVVEGSDDGCSWRTLDEQTNQIFDGRFERKTYKVKSIGALFSTFRFRFLSVRDSSSNSRLQVGCIDLFARSNLS